MTDTEESERQAEQKEEHRLGTIGRWDPPDADWAAEHDWTRYRGPQPYPVPAGWVLSEPEAGAVAWYHFPDVGDGMATASDVYDEFGADADGLEDARGGMAFLINEVITESRDGPFTVEHEFAIGGETVFEWVDPDEDALWAAVAEALARYSEGEDAGGISVDHIWQPEDEAEAERRREANESLGEFS